MTREEIREILKATVLVDGGPESENTFDTVFGCDLMSVLLSRMNDPKRMNRGVVLLTGLTNPQVIRASEIVDIRLVVFLRGKAPPEEETLELARKCGITLMSTPFSIFKSCGLLYSMDMKDIEISQELI